MKFYLFMKLSFVSCLIGLMCCSSCKVPEAIPIPEVSNSTSIPKNIILLIGDGMGIGQITAGTYLNNNRSSLERFPFIGIHKPYASDSLVTDSAAAATAFASGVKTYYGAIGVDADTQSVITILEIAEKKGLNTGLVATSTIVHATPAAFIAHNSSRGNYESIAEDFLKTEIDYFVGGGKKYFDRRQKDDRNLLEELNARNYIVGDYLTDFNQFKASIELSKNVAYLTADDSPLSVYQGRDYLEDASMTGINYLNDKNDNGFFIMIEGSQIDWGGHANSEDWIVAEFIEFSDVIDKVLDWAEADKETLVIVTADHETGGFTIQPGSKMNDLVTAFTTDRHSGDFIPVFAFGPGAEKFSGIYENTEIFHKMKLVKGW